MNAWLFTEVCTLLFGDRVALDDGCIGGVGGWNFGDGTLGAKFTLGRGGT